MRWLIKLKIDSYRIRFYAKFGQYTEVLNNCIVPVGSNIMRFIFLEILCIGSG